MQQPLSARQGGAREVRGTIGGEMMLRRLQVLGLLEVVSPGIPGSGLVSEPCPGLRGASDTVAPL